MKKMCGHITDKHINNNTDFEFIKEIFDLPHEWLYLYKCKKCGTSYLYYCVERGFAEEYIETTVVAVGVRDDISVAEARGILEYGAREYEKRIY